ncbi:CPBP family intramembrane glutamic endopeptidase [Massilia sp. S19_KUP03_FR1]|uniref:CPBP family intramembrane glutamic endopeptidase n=1 Tax=Massilia sp. S19_KUP03_FR1 TaxID=3025503 RepID=UPI002FCD5223
METGVGPAHLDAARQILNDAAAPVPRADIWRPVLAASQALLLVVFLAVLFAAMRGAGMLGPAALRWMLPASFVMMALLPWLLLTPDGRRAIGLRRPASWLMLAPTMLAGAGAALACGALGLLLFGHSPDHWFVTVAASYRGMMDTNTFSTLMLHGVFTLPALLFSPIGEEIFFRGILQRALEERFSTRLSTAQECAAFGLVHLLHHGLFSDASGWSMRPLSGALWVVAMFLTAGLFAAIRHRSGSLFPAMAAHAAFNAAMNTFIFGLLWR